MLRVTLLTALCFSLATLTGCTQQQPVANYNAPPYNVPPYNAPSAQSTPASAGTNNTNLGNMNLGNMNRGNGNLGTDSAPPVSAAPAGLGVTSAGFNALQTGITYAEATRILGSPGTEVSRSDLGGISTVMYQWTAGGLAGMTGGNMNAMFQDGKMISKAQFGLK